MSAQSSPGPGEVEVAVMRNNNNIQEQLLQQENNRREDEAGKEEPRKELSKLELVEHSSQCQASHCAQRKCRKMKELLAHIREGRHTGGHCKTCTVMMRLLTDHARLCQVSRSSNTFYLYILIDINYYYRKPSVSSRSVRASNSNVLTSK